jgi:hypothetical protein
MHEKQRSSKAERDTAKIVLRGLFEKAFSEGSVTIQHTDQNSDSKKKASVLHQALNDYRREVRKKQTELFELYTIVNGCTIKKPDNYTVSIEKKKTQFSERTQAILEVAAMLPDLNLIEQKPKLTNHKATLDAILADLP